ncbi:MAG: hypothetical protein SPK76_03230 [Bacteroidales bacterium]|nr:hypothetical protein [Bacteroidales bacterium]
MDFKPAIKLLGLLLLLLVVIAVAVLSTMGAINYGCGKSEGRQMAFVLGGTVNGCVWAFFTGRYVIRQIKNGKL